MCQEKQLTLYTKLTAGSARAILPPQLDTRKTLNTIPRYLHLGITPG